MDVIEISDDKSGRRNRRQWLRLPLLCLLSLVGFPAHADIPSPFLMVTSLEEQSLMGKWYRRIYDEAFARLGVPLRMIVVPTARLSSVVDQGDMDGQPSRVFAYADSHPNQLRVDEVLHVTRLALYAFGPATKSGDPSRLQDLATGKWRVEYRRGVDICEKTLRPVVPAERLSDVTNVDQGLKKLRARRTDLYCDFDTAVRNEMVAPAFTRETGYRQAFDLNVSVPLYPYVHKDHAELAPRLAETLRQMKAAGLIERYLREAEREQGVTR